LEEARKYVEELRFKNPNSKYSIRNSSENVKPSGRGWWGCGF